MKIVENNHHKPINPPMDQTPLLPELRIAVVDDEMLYRKLIALMIDRTPGLAFAGSYASGKEALAQMPQAPPDVVLMDYMMPELSGIECARRLKAKLPQVPVIIISGLLGQLAAARAREAGASGFMLKPMNRAMLLEVVALARA